MSNKSYYLHSLKAIRDDVYEIVSSHANIRGDDEQYWDPEEEWAVPLLENLVRTISDLEDTDVW